MQVDGTCATEPSWHKAQLQHTKDGFFELVEIVSSMYYILTTMHLKRGICFYILGAPASSTRDRYGHAVKMPWARNAHASVMVSTTIVIAERGGAKSGLA